MKHSINITLVNSNQDLKPIRIRASFGGTRIDLRPSLSYNESKWNPETQRAKNNTRNDNRQSASEVNKILNNAVVFIDEYFSLCELQNIQPNFEELKKKFDSKFKNNCGKMEKGLLEYYDQFIEEVSVEKSLAYNTKRKYVTIRNIIKKMNIKAFTLESLQKIVNSEIFEGKRNTTIAKNLSVIKIFGKWLKNKEIIDFDVDEFKPRLKGYLGNKKAIVYLDYGELIDLLNYDFSDKPSLGVIRDVFCFSAFSGLRYSDIKKLQKNDIKNGCIHVITQKTSESLCIELNKYTRAILDKYKDYDSKFVLPVISNQKTNKGLKEACKIVGIDSDVRIVTFSGSERIEIVKPKYELISFHAARRTFVVECLRREIPAEVIMKWTGHSDFEAMKPYMDIVDSLRKNSMKKFDV